MNWFIILISLLAIDECQDQDKLFQQSKTIYLTENEKYKLESQQFPLITNNTDPDLHQLNLNHEPLIREKYRFALDDKEYSNILTYFTFNLKFIEICFVVQTNFLCNYQVKNELNDEELIIQENNNFTLKTSFNNCHTLNNYKENYYLVICLHELKQIAQIIDKRSNVFDQISVESKNGNNLSIKTKFQQILFYETSTTNLTFVIYSINSNDTFSDALSFDISINEFSGKVISAFWINPNKIMMICEYKEITVELNDKLLFNEKHHYQPGFSPIGYSDNLIYGIDENIEEQFILHNQYLSLSTHSEIPISAFYVSNLVAIVHKQQLIVVQNNVIYETLRIVFTTLVKLGNLPFIIMAKDKELIFLQVKSLPTYLQYTNSNHYFVFHTAASQKQLQPYYSSYEIKKYQIESPSIIVGNNVTTTFILSNGRKQYYDIFSIQLGLPVEIVQFRETKNLIRNFKNAFKIIPLSENQRKNLFILLNGNLAKMFVFESNLVASAVSYESQEIEQIGFITIGLTNVFFSPQSSTIFSATTYELIQYILDIENSRFIKTNVITFDSEIVQIKQQQDYLSLILKNCSSYYYSFSQTYFVSYSVSSKFDIFFSNCTQSILSKSANLMLTPRQIMIFPFQSYTRKYQFTNIVDCDYVQSFQVSTLLIYEVIDDVIIISRYSLDKFDLLFLGKIPTYDYFIKKPLIKRLKKGYLALVGIKEKQEVILIYELSHTLANLLIKIIEIDCNSDFNFFGIDDTIYYFRNNYLYYTYIGKVVVDINNIIDKYVEKLSVDFLLESQIGCDKKPYQASFTLVNRGYSLRLKDQDYLTYYHKNNDIQVINLTNIIGTVNDIKLMNDTLDCSILKPMILLDTINYSCITYIQNSCLTTNYMIFDMFGSDLKYFVNLQFLYLLHINKLSNSLFELIYVDIFQNLKQSRFYYQNNEYISNITTESLQQKTQYQVVKRKIQNYYLIQSGINLINPGIYRYSIILLFENELTQIYVNNEQFYFNADIISLSNDDIIIVTQGEKQQISIINRVWLDNIQNNNGNRGHYDRVHIEFNLDQYPFENEMAVGERYVQEIVILQTNKNQTVLFVKILVFYSSYQGLLYELYIDIEKNSLNHVNQKALRYGAKHILIKLLYSSNSLVILQQSSTDFQNLVHCYDISERQQREIIDSFYQFKNEIAFEIDKYNDTYFTLSEKISESNYRISLIIIDDYILQCKGEEKPQQLLLQNDISNLVVTIKEVEQFTTRNIQHFFLILILGNFFSIILMSQRCNSKQKKKIFHFQKANT